MTRHPTDEDAGERRNRLEAGNIWRVATVGSGRAAPGERAPRAGVREKIRPMPNPIGMAPEDDAGGDRAAVFVGWPRIFPGL